MSVEQELANIVPDRETLLAVGVFDGVHAGHRYLLEYLTQKARENGLLSGVVTFTPHPQSVLHPHTRLPMLGDLSDRIKSLRESGIDLIAVLSFTAELAQLNARDFIVLLKQYLKMNSLMVGPDFALGKGREGNVHFLCSLGQEMAFSVEIIPYFSVNGEIVSSTAIRQALAQGDTEKVANLMGRHFSITARVVSKSKRGRILGFPTANLDVSPEQALPSNGVYATITHINDTHFVSVTNIGTRPTFGDSEKIVETHLLDYKGDLYDKELKVMFIRRLRNEKPFASAEELSAQINKDIERARLVVGELK
jgi:riboflavin kinase/FMN adenylyltransferase